MCLLLIQRRVLLRSGFNFSMAVGSPSAEELIVFVEVIVEGGGGKNRERVAINDSL